jgi:putative FmdB family regulatory protein
MPFYAYNCKSCSKTFKAFHASDEQQKSCIICKSDQLEKAIPTLRTVAADTSKTSAGARVERFIEESRETLKEQLQEARKEIK